MRRKYDFEMMEMDDRMVAVPVGDNASNFSGIIKLNQTAADILALLKNDITEEQVLEQLAKAYDMSSEESKEWVHTFICQLFEQGVVE